MSDFVRENKNCGFRVSQLQSTKPHTIHRLFQMTELKKPLFEYLGFFNQLDVFENHQVRQLVYPSSFQLYVTKSHYTSVDL
ncbi:hypothetical protein Hanom_Chr09g00831161 [Helianthus anomalus]